ncbi:SNAP receptor [Yamadazyma tenuis]|uniref:SNAP receptor n=1 Tax=Candida tenuis TaxID=2315449 RepID=UPI002798CC93|nr:SNAP receptor [Yamadazyma tenuis]
MSFNNFSEDLEAGGADAHSLHYKDFPEFETSSQQIESLLFNINNNQLTSLKNLNSQYDTLLREPPDSTKPLKLNKLSYTITALTEKITKNYKIVNELTQKINSYLNECENNHDDEDTLVYLRQKESLVIKQIKSSLKNYQTHQKKYESLQQKTIDKYGKVTDSVPSEELDSGVYSSGTNDHIGNGTVSGGQVSIEYEPVNAEELEQQTLLIQEREREIEQIGQDITYINEIYGNLEDIVHEQQFTIDTIEDNILKYKDPVDECYAVCLFYWGSWDS